MRSELNKIPLKVFAIDEGEIFLYETVTNRIFRFDVDNLSETEAQKLLEEYLANGKISKQNLDDPKFSMTFSDYTGFIQNKLPKLILETTRRCNMRCSYCVYSGQFRGHRTHQDINMTWDVMKCSIDFYAQHSTMLDEGSISFYGGESLLCFDDIRLAVEYSKRAMPNKKLLFIISTNGLLLKREILNWLSENPNVELNITLNGPPHDKYRKTADGKGTLKAILHNLGEVSAYFPNVWKKQIGFICNYATFEELMDQREFYLRDLKKIPYLINPITSPNISKITSTSSEKSETHQKIVDKYLKDGDEFLESFFRVDLAVIHKRAILLDDCRTFINSCIPFSNGIFVTANGDFQVCTEIVELANLGDLIHGYRYDTLYYLYTAVTNIFKNSECSKCWVQRLCYACLKDFITDTGEVKRISQNYCNKIRNDILNDLKMYCRLAYHYTDLFEKLSD